MRFWRFVPQGLLSLILVLAIARLSPAQNPSGGALTGHVTDRADRPVAGARVRVVNRHGRQMAATVTDAEGRFYINAASAPARLEVTRPGFEPQRISLVPWPSQALRIRLAIAPLRQRVIVAATGSPVPREQLGVATAVIDRDELQTQMPLTLTDGLRLAPGLAMTVSGQSGALTTPAVRGGPPQFIKLLLDGIPLQRFDFGSYLLGNLLAANTQEIEMVRGPDSVIYGSDAASGVIAVRSRRGSDVPAPELDVETLFGSDATSQQDDQLLGSGRGLDYALNFGHYDTHNQAPNSKFRAINYGGDFGLALPRATELRATVARIAGTGGSAGTLDFYGLADNAFLRQNETYERYSLKQQTARRWWNRLALDQAITSYFYEKPGPVGELTATIFGPAYLGLPVTIAGANGYAVSGQAILDYGGPYPQITTFGTARRDVDWESGYDFATMWHAVGGYRYYDESGGGSTQGELSRHDHGVYGELSGGWRSRLFASAGGSEDWNTPFGRSFSPQASVAWLARTGAGWLNETRVRASGGGALADPNLFQEASSLYLTLEGLGRPDLISQYAVRPALPQRARSGDFGLDQFLAGDRVRVGVTGFDAHYYDRIEYVPSNGLVALGIPASVAAATEAVGGATVNSLSEVAKGVESEVATRSGPLRLMASFTYQDARVLRSLSSDALAPTVNPAFPGVLIGAYAPLPGARPFRVPPENLQVRTAWQAPRWTLATTFWWQSRQDDSTFLSDANYGPSLLLPNRNLDPAFSSLNFSGYFHLTPRVVLEAAVDNALDNRTAEAIGYPGLGFTARAGIRFRWGLPLPR